MSIHPDREKTRAMQLNQLNRLIGALIDDNRFYSPRLKAAGLTSKLDSIEAFTSRMPFTLKSEMVADQADHPPYGSNLTYPLSDYVHMHQTSGTTGSPMRWLDTEESWSWMLDNWKEVLLASRVTADDVIFFAFSFGPFLGFWTAYGAAERLGCLCISGGGMTSEGRLETLLANQVTTICCTPTYALRLGQIAVENGVDLSGSAIKTIIVAGEPGGSVPSTRERISQLWNGARVFDHHGMTEVGPVTIPNFEHPYVLHVLEESYLAEVLDPDTLEQVAPGQTGELILTTLGRLGSPLLRYRTGDLVRLSSRTPEALGTARMALEGGILTRNDDMLIVRGINIFPASVEEVMRRFPEVAEYQVEVAVNRAMTELKINVEPSASVTDTEGFKKTLEESLRTALQIRIPVQLVPQNSLPRFEMKAKRWVRLQ